MKEVKLIEDRPFMMRGSPVFGTKGHIFEVMEEKELPMMGLGYKVRYKDYPSMIMDGWNRAKDFEVVGDQK